MKRNAIFEALRANHWNRRKAAQELKISYRALIYKIRDRDSLFKRPAGQARSGKYTGFRLGAGDGIPAIPN